MRVQRHGGCFFGNRVYPRDGIMGEWGVGSGEWGVGFRESILNLYSSG
jgi:hypothetical protein